MASAKNAKESGSNGHHRIIAVIPAYNEERFILLLDLAQTRWGK